MFKANTSIQERDIQVSYELSFLLAKNARPHTDGENVLKPALEIYFRTMQNKPAAQELTAVPLSNDTVRRLTICVTIWRSSWSPSSGQPSSPWPSTNIPSATVKRFYSPTPDFSTTNLLWRCCFVNLSKPPQLRWTFTLWSRTILVKRTFRFQTLCLPQQMALPQ